MVLRLLVSCEWDGHIYKAGTELSIPSAVGVEMIQDQVAVPVQPPVSRQVIRPEEQRHDQTADSR